VPKKKRNPSDFMNQILLRIENEIYVLVIMSGNKAFLDYLTEFDPELDESDLTNALKRERILCYER